jgi:hypothetical protein
MHVQLMAAEVCVKKIEDARHMYPYQYPGVTRPDVHGKVGGRSFFENLRLLPASFGALHLRAPLALRSVERLIYAVDATHHLPIPRRAGR